MGINSVIAVVTFTRDISVRDEVPGTPIIQLAVVENAAPLTWKEIVIKAARQEGWINIEDPVYVEQFTGWINSLPDDYIKASSQLYDDYEKIAVRKWFTR
jgi:hypothetical protein